MNKKFLWGPGAVLLRRAPGCRRQRVKLLFFLIIFYIIGIARIEGNNLVVRVMQVDVMDFPRVSAFVSVTDAMGCPVPGVEERDFSVMENRGGEIKEARVVSIVPVKKAPVMVHIILLLDTSGSMKGRKMEQAGEAVRAFWRISTDNFSVSLATFNTNVNETVLVSGDSIENTLNRVKVGGSTFLYGAVLEKLRELKQLVGRKVIVVLTDGQDNVRTLEYKPILLNEIAGSNVSIFTIGLGSDVDGHILQDLADKSGGKYAFAPTEERLKSIFEGVAEEIANEFLVTYETPFRDYNGLERGIAVMVSGNGGGASSTNHYRKGGVFDQGIGSGNGDVKGLSIWGLVVLIGVLLVFIFLLPLIRWKFFKLTYVHRYRYLKNQHIKNKIDLYSMEYFIDDTEVVTKCQHWVSLKSWKRNGNKCPEYPDRCASGYGNLCYHIDFFRQQGSNRYLNWLWFGALGGWGAWVVIVFFLEPVVGKIVQGMSVTLDSNIISCLGEMVTGFFMGGCLGLSLGLVDEVIQGISFYSIKKTVKRMFYGAVAGSVAFLAGNLLFILVLNSDYTGRLLGWLIFGTLLGGGLTAYSGSEYWKGMLGGFLGAVLGFHLYYINITADLWRADLAKLMGLVFLGASIGIVTSVVLTSLQDFYFECVSGQRQGVNIAISKWLKRRQQDRGVIIGSAKDCHIFIPGDKGICDHHVQIQVDSTHQAVFITPLAPGCPVEVNQRRIVRSIRMKDGDIVKIGNTQLKYHEKRKYLRNGV